ncbi:Ankyrin repeat domain-containing protein 50 [Talaromyces islandicus]|uniref:Ankyrin repeat domain-containing protein 50 n=1 Tax=Talaromyces islandicus TaxID=28573 RepID=A0A0U1LZ83_TALIS|nr:Ankyrin repeat domain-containing protein 50 [Talaromyces islandicus]
MDNEIFEPEARPAKRSKTFHHASLPTTQHNHYTIAWICALYIEMAAAQAMLDEIHGTPPRDPDDTNIYVLGSIGRHNVVITCLPAGQYGTINAATVATNLKRTFPRICITLMVGIGGGAPCKEDVRLGDVVVGTRVMQYDLGKIVTDGKFDRTAVPRLSQPLLGAALTNLRAKHELSPSRIPHILQQRLGSHTEYDRPLAPDNLFQATYEHESQASNCDLCDQSKLKSRSRRPPSTIKIHHGGIASGNQVMKHGTTRDHVARELDIICFEMEAAGLMDIMPCLPIRGICDYSDTHKNKEWQRYAAATAAAYARELIEELPVTEEQARAAYLSTTSQDMPDNRQQRLMKSLEFKQMESRKITIKKNLAKTCQWLLDHPDYKAWLDPARLAQHYGFLWISGKPGAGKSTIMKFAYLEMKKTRRKDAKTASFFFNARGESLEKSTSGMYRSLLLQLLEEYRDLQTVLDDPENFAQNQEDCPPINVLKDLFHNAVAALGQRQFTCFIDALDECDEQQVMDMVEFFEDLGELVLKRGIRLTLEDQSGHAADLGTYITSRLRIKNELLIAELKPELLRKAAGVFMWVVLVVQILNDEDRKGGLALRKRLDEIPGDLSQLFKRILTRDKENMNSLLLCIRWILFAERPLEPDEFRHALWSGLSLKDMADDQIPAAVHAEDRGSLDKIVISSSKGLAEITKSKSPTVQFIHESVRDFLIKDNGLHDLWPGLETEWESSSHEELKQYCNFYLNHPSVSSSVENLAPWSKSTAQEEISKKYPFLKYSSQSILYHANSAAKMISQDGFLSDFSILNWIKTNNLFEKHKIREYTLAANLFYILADKGFPKLIRTRLEKDPNVHVLGERYCYPIFAALTNGNKGSVAALLNLASSIKNGTDITEGLKYRNDLKKYKDRTPLSWAAQDGRLDILKLLIQTGSAIDEEDGGGRTGLSRASENGHEAVVKLLIDKGADVNCSSKNGFTPLLLASNNSHEVVARLLIDKGADVNARNNEGWTSLLWASQRGHEELARLFIDRGADVNASDNEGRTSLLWTSQRGHEELARLLIDKGADVNASNNDGQRSLLWASQIGYKGVMRLLIDKGADVNARDNNGRTSLLWTSQRGYERVIRLLIDKGADVNASDNEGWTSLL